MAALTLKGYFIKVNKYGRLKFRYLGGSDDTPSRLVTATGDILGQLYTEYAKKCLLNVECSDSEGEHDDSDVECSYSNKCSEVSVNSCNDGVNSCNDGATLIKNNITPIKTAIAGNVHTQPHLPFDDSTFTVVMPKWIKKPPQDILSRVGLICVIEVKAVKYEFSSTAKHNMGEHITGFQLVFSKVIKEIR